MPPPTVSVITPTYERADLLAVCIANVRAQTYPMIEHVVVIDGPDSESYELCEWASSTAAPGRDFVYAELGRNWSTFLPDAYAAAPTTVAMLLASGTYQMFLADDEHMEPDHVAALVELLERTGADLAYSKVEMYRKGSPSLRWVIGVEPPERGQITNALYRAEVLKRGLYVVGDQYASDWATIDRWLRSGARWAFLDRVTLTHRADR